MLKYFKKRTVKNERKQVNVLFVCMGNICRSPTAQGVFQALVDEAGLGDSIRVDSAGTHSYHVASPPDPRSQAAARERGVDLSGLRGRRFEDSDFTEFDYLIAMDQGNIDDMCRLKPPGASAAVHLMLEFSKRYQQAEVPDPYYGDDGFEIVFDMVSDGAEGLLEHIQREHTLPS